jgi:hypothetical protein
MRKKRVAAMFDCNNGSLPLKYLGIMVDNKHMSASDLRYVHLKVEKRIPTWQSVGLSSGGKMRLTESALAPYQLIQWVSIICKRRFTKRWTQPELTSSGMGRIRKENTIWQSGE